MHALARELKRCAPTTMDLAVVPGLSPEPRTVRRTEHAAVRIVQLQFYALLLLGLALPGARAWGLAALVAFQLQPLLALGGTRLRPPDLLWITFTRLPVEIWLWLVAVVASPPPEEEDEVERRRPVYTELLADGLQRFFEPRRESCPLCDGTRLTVRLETTDLMQHKPGRFTLERCGDCGHIFQNPRLTIEGLNFYYKDAYDGLGEAHMDAIFGYSKQPYLARARMLSDAGAPRRWLDVGGGHGHFCCTAREVWTDTTFDCLDLSESVEEAARRGWADTGYRGLFPELASTLSEQYDVVSMSHYLEHTTDPVAEIAAAHVALAPEGRLLIEVPNPESPLGRILGRWWIPWFQPQHLHLIPASNLGELLRAHGFEPEVWHHAEAHQKVDLLLASTLILGRVAGQQVPWKAPFRWYQRTWQLLVVAVFWPLVVVAIAADQVCDPLVRRLGWSNTYRVLARKV